MSSRTQRIFVSTAVVTVIAVTASYFLSFMMHWAAAVPARWLDWIACLVIPVSIGIPIGWYVFSKNEDLKAAHVRLERAHKDLNKAHDRLTFVSRHDHLTGLLNR